MALLDYLSRSTSQSTVAIDAQPATVAEVPTLAPVVAVEELKEEAPVAEASAPAAEPVVVPEVLAASSEPTVVAPVEKQPTTTHAETGTAHVDAEVATKVDGTTAVPEVEAKEEVAEAAPVAEGSKAVVEEPKEKKDKIAVKDKVEKTKAEGKGFFAKIFGSKEKSPKKPKVKTPKVEKSDPIAAEETTPVADATAVETAAVDETPAAEVTGAALTTDTAVPAPVQTEAPAVPSSESKPEVIAAKDVEAAPVAETSTVAETAPVETKIESKKGETPNPRATKMARRLSARIYSIIAPKHHKKDGTTTPPKEAEVAKETEAVSDEAPKLDEPTATEPLKMDETKTTAPPAAPVVSTTA